MHHVRVVQLLGDLDNCYICVSSSQRSNLWHMSLHRTTLHGFHIVWRKIGHLRMQETFLNEQRQVETKFHVVGGVELDNSITAIKISASTKFVPLRAK